MPAERIALTARPISITFDFETPTFLESAVIKAVVRKAPQKAKSGTKAKSDGNSHIARITAKPAPEFTPTRFGDAILLPVTI